MSSYETRINRKLILQNSVKAGSSTIDVPQPIRRSVQFLFITILLAAAFVRFASVWERNYWLDELWTIELSTGRGSVHLALPVDQLISPAPERPTDLVGAPSILSVWTHMGSATHPPLYFVALRLWEEVFGNSEFATRSLSAICSILAIALLFDVANRLHGSSIALWACALFAVAWPQVVYGREARNYAMLVMVALAAADALIRIEKRGFSKSRIAALTFFVLAAMLTHYFAAGAIAAMFVYAMIKLRGTSRRMVAGAFIGAALLFGAMWGPFLIAHLRTFGGSDPTTEFLRRTDGTVGQLIALASLPLRLACDVPRASWGVASLSIVVLIVPAFQLRRRPALLFGWLWTVGTIGFVAALDVLRSTAQLDFIRYTMLAAPGLYMFLVASAEAFDKRLSHVVAGLLVAACIFDLPDAMNQRVPNWPVLSRLIDDRTIDRDAFLFAAPGESDSVTGYLWLAVTHYSKRAPSAVALIHAPTSSTFARNLIASPRVWFISKDKSVRPDQLLPGMRAVSAWDADGSPAAIWLLVPSDSSRVGDDESHLVNSTSSVQPIGRHG